MTMQKERNPLDPSSPAARAISLAGVDALADAVDRGPSLIRDWADDGSKASPNMWQAMACDRVCIAIADEAPFRDFYNRWAEAHRADYEDPTIAAARGVDAVTAALMEVVEARNPNSENGQDLSENEVARIARKCADAHEEIDRVQRAVMRGATNAR